MQEYFPELEQLLDDCEVTSNKECIKKTSIKSSRSIISSLQQNDGYFEYSININEAKESILSRYTGLSLHQFVILVCLCILQLNNYCVMSILTPFFPKEAEMKGMTLDMSGLTFSMFAVVVVITSPFMGFLVSLVNPKNIIVGALFLSGLCNIGFGFFANIQSLDYFTLACFTTRIFEGIAASANSVAIFTILASVFPDRIGGIMGIVEVFVGLGLSVGPAIGGLLYNLGGFSMPFWVIGTITIAFIPVTMIALPVIPYQNVNKMENKGGIFEIIKIPSIILILCSNLITAIGWCYLSPIFEPHLRKEFDASPSTVGLLLSLLSIAYAISSPIWGKIVDLVGTETTWKLIVVGLFGSSIGIVLLGPTPYLNIPNQIWMKAVALIVFGLSSALALLPTFKSMLDYAIADGFRDNESTSGIISGLWTSVYSLGEIIGPIGGAALDENFGFSICSTVVAGLHLLMGVVLFIFFANSRKSPKKYHEMLLPMKVT